MFKALLIFLRILDEEERLSLTNLSMMLVIGKIALSASATSGDLIALSIVVLNYIGKKVILYFQSKNQKPSKDLSQLTEDVTSLKADLETLKNKVNSLVVAAGFRSPRP